MAKGFGYYVIKSDGKREYHTTFRSIAEAYYLTVQTVSYWFYHGKVSEIGRQCGIKEIVKA